MSKLHLYFQITHLYIFEVHSNFARTGIDFPKKKQILLGNSELLGNYWAICNLAVLGLLAIDMDHQLVHEIQTC